MHLLNHKFQLNLILELLISIEFYHEQCVILFLNISSLIFAIIFISYLQANIPRACDLNHFHTYVSPPCLQVTLTNDLILNTIWLLIDLLVSRFNAGTLFFTLAMIPRSQVVACPSLSLSTSKTFPCYLHVIKTYSSHIILSIYWQTISSIF